MVKGVCYARFQEAQSLHGNSEVVIIRRQVFARRFGIAISLASDTHGRKEKVCIDWYTHRLCETVLYSRYALSFAIPLLICPHLHASLKIAHRASSVSQKRSRACPTNCPRLRQMYRYWEGVQYVDAFGHAIRVLSVKNAISLADNWYTHSVDSKNARTSVLRCKVGCLDSLWRNNSKLNFINKV